MQVVFFTSSALLAFLALVRYVEQARGQRMAASVRASLDTAVLYLYRNVVSGVLYVREYVNRDMVVKILHVCTYVALLLVRVVERKLADTTKLLRSFRKKRQPRSTSPGLERVVRGVDSE
jgi:hypothetical protein